MGFEISDTVSIYNIKFGPNSAYHGLSVEAAGMSIGEYNTMMRLALASVTSAEGAERAEANVQSNDHVRDCFYRRILAWNLTKNNEPVKVSEEVFNELDSRLVTVLIRCWLDELTAIPEDLLGKSSDGETSEVPSMTMVPLSPNHQN